MTDRVCIDRILPRDLMRPQRLMPAAGNRLRAISEIGKAWINGSTLRVRFIGGSAAERSLVMEQANWWGAVANIKFEFNDANQAEIRISFDQSDGAWSYVGTDCQHIPFDQPTMNLGFLDEGTPAHEIGHALALSHEHQNPAGGIQWNEPVVIQRLAGPPNFWDEETVRHNVLNKYRVDQINGTQFDPDSIMLYFFPASWTLNGVETKSNSVLSDLDKAFIAGSFMYPGVNEPVLPEPVLLSVNAHQSTPASIGKFGEEDLFKFVASKDGRHVVDTYGNTDVVMKLFGPNSRTALIAEDDDSGYGLNARIARILKKGEYFVQVRHYNIRKGTGNYSIRVKQT